MDHRRGAARVACCLALLAAPLAAAGWTPSAPEAKTYGPTATCRFIGNARKHETVIMVVSRPVPKFASSTAMAARRSERAKHHPELATKVSPLEGLGAPAIRSEDSSAPPTVEAAGRRLGVTAPTLGAAQALAKTAIARLH